jgi:hypothetical protein
MIRQPGLRSMIVTGQSAVGSCSKTAGAVSPEEGILFSSVLNECTNQGQRLWHAAPRPVTATGPILRRGTRHRPHETNTVAGQAVETDPTTVARETLPPAPRENQAGMPPLTFQERIALE